MNARFACVLTMWGAAALLPTAAFVACSGTDHGTGSPVSQKAEGGSASVVALALSASNVASVTVTVSGGTLKGSDAGISTPLVFPMQKSGSQWTSLLSNLPAGTGFTFAVSAVDSSGNPLYQGSANSVTITAGKTAQVVITAQQATPATPFANAAPVIDSLVLSATGVSPGGSVNLAVTAHDPNASDTLTYSWSAAYTATVGGVSDISTYGTFSAPGASATSWTAPSSTGSFQIIVRVQDSKGATVVATTTVTVAAATTGQAQVSVNVNTWPVVTNVVGSPNYVVKAQPTLLTAQANDADNDPLTYMWSTACAGTLSNPAIPTPSFTLASTSTDTSCTFSVIVSDNRGGSDTGTLVLPVGAPSFGTPQVPVFSNFSQSSPTVGAGQTVSFSVQASDPAGGALTYQWWTSAGSFANEVETATGSQITWAPPANAAASWTIVVTAKDAAGLTSSQTFTVLPSSCFGAQPASNAWSYGIMADTQWTVTDDGRNPSSDAIDIINQLNAQFVAKGVKFVVAVGDVTDNGSNLALDVRARYAQALYNAGIGFFPLRGNHESSAAAAKEFPRIFPQTLSGANNSSPSDILALTTADDSYTNPVAPTSSSPFSLGTGFSSPSTALTGLSYTFTYNNAQFVLLDQFTPADGSSPTVDSQQAWISSSLAARPSGGHGFVFAHKGLITENHVDVLFGSDPSQDPTGTDAFIKSLAANGVHYYVGGHDHMHNRSIVTTTDGTSASVQAIIAASDSSKFYQPAATSNDQTYDVKAFGHTRQTQISQELAQVGYYVVTVNGALASVDYYGAQVNPSPGSGEYLIATTPPMSFVKRETYGYGLNGKEFIVAEGATYTTVTDTFGGTTATILSGTNMNTAKDASGRALSATVDTGWTAATCATTSSVLSLWITPTNLGSPQTDTYALQLSASGVTVPAATLTSGSYGLVTQDANGNWINAVDQNVGGTKAFVSGPWAATYTLGTYGVDPATGNAWAVLNYSANFAIAQFTN